MRCPASDGRGLLFQMQSERLTGPNGAWPNWRIGLFPPALPIDALSSDGGGEGLRERRPFSDRQFASHPCAAQPQMGEGFYFRCRANDSRALMAHGRIGESAYFLPHYQ